MSEQKIKETPADILLHAFSVLRVAFKRLDMLPPSVVELENKQEGDRFIAAFTHLHMIGHRWPKIVQTGPDSFRYECSVNGIKVRWPTHD